MRNRSFLFVTPILVALQAVTGFTQGLSPVQSLSEFHTVPGIRLDLVASEPQVFDPVAMAFDPAGRLYVVENRDYPTGPTPGHPGSAAVALLEDRDKDGVFETRHDFATGFRFPGGILPSRGGVYVTDAPDLLYLKDTDGDGIADVREVVLTGFAEGGSTQLRVSHPTLGLDGCIYLTNGLSGGAVSSPQHPEIEP
ncbi:MAG: dehydrogenase, partial [Candidatus Omnitrophica bacterium]|nr:dehydrogenase [Candidatus Omnitrophota bacterium]